MSSKDTGGGLSLICELSGSFVGASQFGDNQEETAAEICSQTLPRGSLHSAAKPGCPEAS